MFLLGILTASDSTSFIGMKRQTEMLTEVNRIQEGNEAFQNLQEFPGNIDGELNDARNSARNWTQTVHVLPYYMYMYYMYK